MIGAGWGMGGPSRSEVASLGEAYALLGLSGPAGPEETRAAFRTAVKAARPDAHDGDEARFRRVIEAWRLVRTDAPTAPAGALPPPEASVVITPLQALRGATIEIEIDGRRHETQLKPGMRTGDRLRLRDEDGGWRRPVVLVRPDGDLRIVGSDVFIDWPVPPRLIEDGGRLEIETWAGPRPAWITPGQPSLRLCLQGLGLPARRGRPAGRLFVTLVPRVDAPSPAEDRLAAFTRLWTPERRAA